MNDEITTPVGHELYSFDGRILEIFGGDPLRYHIRHMHLSVTGPDRKGKRTVEISQGTPEVPGTRSQIWRYTAAEWEQAHGLAALLEAVQAAIDSTSGHGPA